MSVIIIDSLDDLTVAENAANTEINLFENFDDPFTTGLVARFELYDTTLGNGGITEVLLFDQEGEGAPLSVANFREYVEDGDYVNSIIHRSVPGFIIQGGGFTVDGLEAVLNQNPNSGADAIEPIPTNPPVVNEFDSERSNLRGTIAFAKVGGNPDSATSQWFFNLANNAANLDNQNGGFTVFGQVLGDDDLETIDAIADLPIFNASGFFNQGALTDLPLDIDPNNPDVQGDNNLVRYRSITVSVVDELEFSVVSNSNPSLVTTNIVDGELVLDYQPNQNGTAEIVVRAINLLGETQEDTFTVTVDDVNNAPTFTSNATFSVAENTTTVATVTATDVDGDNLTYSLSGGDDQNLLTINPTTGNLSFVNAPDFENPADANNDNVFEVEVSVSDGTEVVTQNLNITVTDVDEQTPNNAPTFTSNATFSVAENTTTVATVTATDADGDNLTYSLSGGDDRNLFAINASTGNLSFVNAPDFENPADANNDNVFEVEVSVSDGTEVVTQDINVTVTDVNEVEPDEIDLFFGSTENDGLIPGLIAEDELVFTGEGNDSVELGTNNTNNRVYLGSGDDNGIASANGRFFGGDGADELDSSIGDGGNRLYGGEGDDEIVVGSGDRAFGGEGDDTLDASVGNGNNRLYGGVGNDTFFLGNNDNAIAGAGDDILFAQGANSIMTGGAGADQFWIASGEIPADANIISDFEVGIDLLRVNSNLINSFDELTITDSPDQTGAIIAQGDNNLAVLLGIEASAISESNFAFGDSVI
ncbi:peptidylprolyl isomerase [Oscillatoria salina]|uniref:peptidylprolyl isomerase n=1 Tax=Oscillatoria salina TaxID=331517 RepID=UPI001CCDF76A|nr:peptidylprolyl isomerase [Oscillatoria salina]MBZ8182155.1 hypothetical protein [Oscillatoria salina IIICB1]